MTQHSHAAVVLLSSLLLLTVVAERRAFAQEGGQRAPEGQMTTYQLVLVRKGTQWGKTAPAVLNAHKDYVHALLRSGTALIGGSFAGDSGLRGMYLLPGSVEKATSVASDDPGVKGGVYAFELLQWMGPEGWFRRPLSDVTDTETIYFGFLVTGPAPAPPADEARALMQSHLAHLESQAALGKLVMAGPLVKAQPRRGVIAYRVPTMAEAMERASADPMVKSGRMAAELYECHVPKGILK
jgi:uncharacterized protein YciI